MLNSSLISKSEKEFRDYINNKVKFSLNDYFMYKNKENSKSHAFCITDIKKEVDINTREVKVTYTLMDRHIDIGEPFYEYPSIEMNAFDILYYFCYKIQAFIFFFGSSQRSVALAREFLLFRKQVLEYADRKDLTLSTL